MYTKVVNTKRCLGYVIKHICALGYKDVSLLVMAITDSFRFPRPVSVSIEHAHAYDEMLSQFSVIWRAIFLGNSLEMEA